MTVFLGTLGSAIKEVKAPFLLDVEEELLCKHCSGIGPHLWIGESLMFFLKLQLKCGVYSRFTMDMALQDSCLFSDVRTPLLLQGTTRDSLQSLAGQYEDLSM